MLEFENEHYIGKAAPYSGGGSTEFAFMKMLSDGTFSDGVYEIEVERELGDLSTETYNASFTIEQLDNDHWSIVGGALSKDGTEIGTTELYIQIAEYNGSASTYQKLPSSLTKETEESGDLYGFTIGNYQCGVLIGVEDNAVSFQDGGASVGIDMVGSCDLYLKIPPQPLPEE